MKLTLGTTELADIPDEIAEQVLRVFKRPGRLRGVPTIAPMELPQSALEPIGNSSFAFANEDQGFDVILELEAAVRWQGDLVNTRPRSTGS